MTSGGTAQRHSLADDALRDFSPIILVADVPTILAAHPQVGASTVKELIAVARAKPGKLNCAAGGVGDGVRQRGACAERRQEGEPHGAEDGQCGDAPQQIGQ